MSEFSDFIVNADESGDHGMVNIDPQFPVFALTFCGMRKNEYIGSIVPTLQRFKFGIWGNDSVVLHEHEIRKSHGPFLSLRADSALRNRIFDELNGLIETTQMKIYASVIDKERHRAKYSNPWSPYEIALHFFLERLHGMLIAKSQQGKIVHVVFESQGPNEDADLESEFLYIARYDWYIGYRRPDFDRFDLRPVFVPKAANSTGLRLADLIASPKALPQLRPGQPNRAHEIIWPKLGGIKCFP